MSHFAECKEKYMTSERENTEKRGFVVACLQGCLTVASGHWFTAVLRLLTQEPAYNKSRTYAL